MCVPTREVRDDADGNMGEERETKEAKKEKKKTKSQSPTNASRVQILLYIPSRVNVGSTTF